MKVINEVMGEMSEEELTAYKNESSLKTKNMPENKEIIFKEFIAWLGGKEELFDERGIKVDSLRWNMSRDQSGIAGLWEKYRHRFKIEMTSKDRE